MFIAAAVVSSLMALTLVASILRHDYLRHARGKRVGAHGFFASDS